MHHEYVVNDTELTVETTPLERDGRTTLTLDETRWEAALVAAGAHRVQLRMQGERREAWAVRDGDGVWVWMNGRARLVRDAEAARSRRGSSGGGVGKDVTPPMPAVVTKVLVAEGDAVEKGQGLVVVSAMKMEMTLVAPFAGTVAAVQTEPGAKVNPGDILVDVTPADGGEEETDG